MVRRLAAPLALLLALLLAPTAADAVSRSALVAGLQARTAKLGPKSGAYVRDLTANTTLFDRRRGLALSPASNEKLYTTAAALLRWGVDGRFTTTVRAPAPPDAKGVLRGNVVLVGAGDPSLGDTLLRNLASDLARAGVKRITGRIVADEAIFDTRRGDYDAGWRSDTLELGGWLGGLVWGHGRVGSDGPAMYTAARLRYWLGKARIAVAGRERVGTAGNATLILGSASSPTMASLVATTLVPSDNFYAEMLAKGLGAAFGSGGTGTAGAAVVRSTIARFGIHPTIVDGSGLSPVNHTSPAQIVTLLTEMADEPEGAAWRAAMPTPGRTGTLANRMRGTLATTRCKAKTGTLHDVSALSGYCTVHGHQIVFSFLENAVDPYYAKAIEDQMVPLIASYQPAG